MTKNTNKIALVTGGSRGLGKSMAEELAKKGFDVIITYKSKSTEAENTINTINKLGQSGYAIQLDVAESSSFDAFVSNLSSVLASNFNSRKLDALVNNAGVGSYEYYSESTEKEFDTMVNVHLKAPFFLTQKLLPLLNPGTSIVNVSSGLARFSLPGYAAYASMKGGVEVLSRYQAKELSDRKIRVNTVAPGAIETDFGGGVVRDNKDLNGFIASLTALGRVGLPDDIGSVVAFLCSDESKWINAQRIEVSGGIYV
ncbi:MAG: SDR family oxidoreductase [Flavobacteriaceae bacterium]|nr:SDR family oxidoreductase [Flavobacteriaceae bacterium]